MKFQVSIFTPMYEHNNKKYIRVLLNDHDMKRVLFSHNKHNLVTKHVEDPLEGHVLTIKVPFRYNRVMCRFEGVPVQSLKEGDDVEIDVSFMGKWTYEDYSGYTWKLSYIKFKNEINE